MNIQEALDATEPPEGVEYTFHEGTQEVEVIINGENGQVVMIEDIDPVYEQLEESVPEIIYAENDG